MRDLGAFASGERFAGRYEIERLLKAGGMGAVYVATHAATRRKVAIKLMHPDIVADAEARARFVQEAQVATLIQSQHVVDVIDAGVDEAKSSASSSRRADDCRRTRSSACSRRLQERSIARTRRGSSIAI
jgi:serine/threonine protein kinase